MAGIGTMRLHAQQSTVATGGDGTGNGGTFSFSTGLTDYYYITDQGDDPLRFKLHPSIEPPMATLRPEENQTTMVWVHGNTLYVGSADVSLTITLYSIGGGRLQKFNPGTGDTEHPLSLDAGAYLLRIYDNQGVRAKKIIVPYR